MIDKKARNLNQVKKFLELNPEKAKNNLLINFSSDFQTKAKFTELKELTGLTSAELLKVLIESFTKPKQKPH